ncbi:hypothetical protein PY365_31605 [Roseiarcaceae bacterium H3SJ34-1]|uniref:hypothetical protein n=1 Tax=Terripilifer ovatus TaxID=3032367 RepID=UPI003AB9AB1A|nr:hypothetical protein [Roseiarcaceae bacterium H3SJ34-1]
MRTLMALTALSVLAFTAPIQAQSQVPQSSRDGAAADTQPVPKLTKVEIVDFSDLSVGVQNQVAAVIATTKQEDMQKLHQSIDAIPEASQALKAKGVSTSQIVVASLDETGTLTLITKSS